MWPVCLERLASLLCSCYNLPAPQARPLLPSTVFFSLHPYVYLHLSVLSPIAEMNDDKWPAPMTLPTRGMVFHKHGLARTIPMEMYLIARFAVEF
jgi:hypothetical protein